MAAWGHRGLGIGLLALSLAACVANGGGSTGLRAVRSPKAEVKPSPLASLAPKASPKAEAPASAPPPAQGRLLMPSRLGLVLPATLVGPQARLRLTGGDGVVDYQGSRLELTPGGSIISNHSGALISDQGGNLISDQGGGIISNHSGALISDQGSNLISDQGGGIISNHSGAYRLFGQAPRRLQAELEAPPLDDPRLHLWLVLTLIDLNDQLIKGFLDAKPKLGEWTRYGGSEARLLPPPVLGEVLEVAMGQVRALFGDWRFAGVLTQEGQATHLRVVALKAPEQPLQEGFVMLDMVASGADEAVAKTRFMPELATMFGLDGSAARVHWKATPDGPIVEVEEAEHHLPKEQRSGIGALLSGSAPQVVGQRKLRLHAPRGLQRHWGDIGSASVVAHAKGLAQRQFYVAIGYAKPFEADPGLAFFNLRRTAFLGATPPAFGWNDPFKEDELPYSQGPVATYMTSAGRYTTEPSEALKAFLPPWMPEAPEALIPKGLTAEARPHESPDLAPQAIPAALWALPERSATPSGP
jgi:hypothetical protein